MPKRKRHRPSHAELVPNGRPKISDATKSASNAVKHSVLEQFYPRVATLREYLLSKLPVESKIRRKKLATAGTPRQALDASSSIGVEDAALIANVLDTTLVGIPDAKDNASERGNKWNAYMATQMETSEITYLNDFASSQSEIVDFVIWLLHAQNVKQGIWMKHLLGQGYRKGPAFSRLAISNASIGGLNAIFPNQYVELLKSSPWPETLKLLGRRGDLVMIDLLFDCALFRRAECGVGNYYQISGVPLGDLKVMDYFPAAGAPVSLPEVRAEVHAASGAIEKSPAAIQFVRNRMLYARPVLNSRGVVTFGLRHIHVLNRYPLPSQTTVDVQRNTENERQISEKPHPSTVQVLMYMFPRQFGLHNVFTSILDTRETVQPFKDYTVRDEDIQNLRRKPPKAKVPKRLRDEATRLVQRLQILHQRCPYDALLKYHCARQEEAVFSSSCETSQSTLKSTAGFMTQKSLTPRTQSTGQSEPAAFEGPPRKLNVMDHATSVAKVSAFCRSVLSRIVPDEFWGAEEDQSHNKQIFLNNVDRFVRLRRFESLSLHDVMHGMKISSIPWLSHNNSTAKGSQSDTRKREELFLEFVYYVFDSLLIPLMRCNFHVTESSVHRYRIFFFRHDIWRIIAEPAMLQIKHSMFEEVDPTTAQKILESRRLGFSQLRLLPKESGVRPIMNLRRRPLKKGSKMLGSSINSILAPVYNMLTFEKEQEPLKFGSTLFSVGDLYSKLKAFKERVGKTDKPFYFCKVDVRSAFDTIPQEAVVRLVSSLPTSTKYHVSKHVEIKPADGHGLDIHSGSKRAKPMRKWVALANNKKDTHSFGAKVETLIGAKRKNTVFVGNVGEQTHNKDQLIKLLQEHVQQNLVKIGKKYYRQKNGIPQGSVISSLLCNYFYADLEAQHLDFLQPESCLLLRLIDDFLLITTEPTHAQRFLQIMHNGIPFYGITVNPSKTLTNFETSINSLKLARLVSTSQFPYCGTLIHTSTLHISKNREGRNEANVKDSLTVEYSKMPGRTFQRKVMNTFKIQCHAMFIDTKHNSKMVVARNVFEIFEECAKKMCAYDSCLPKGKRAGREMLVRTIDALLEMAWVLMRSKGGKRNTGFRCAIERGEVRWLGLRAFEEVLGRRQSRYAAVVEWVGRELGAMEGRFRGRKVPVRGR